MALLDMSYNDEGGEGGNNKFNNYCTQNDNFNDNDLVVRGSVSGNNDQEITANTKGEEVLYVGRMAAAQQETDSDNDDDDNVVRDWDLDKDLVVEGSVAKNNNQEIATNIKKKKTL